MKSPATLGGMFSLLSWVAMFTESRQREVEFWLLRRLDDTEVLEVPANRLCEFGDGADLPEADRNARGIGGKAKDVELLVSGVFEVGPVLGDSNRFFDAPRTGIGIIFFRFLKKNAKSDSKLVLGPTRKRLKRRQPGGAAWNLATAGC